jgi:hypothetical protein
MAKRAKVETWTVKTDDGSELARVEISTQFSRRALLTLKQAALTAPQLRQLLRVLTRAAEKLDG